MRHLKGAVSVRIQASLPTLFGRSATLLDLPSHAHDMSAMTLLLLDSSTHRIAPVSFQETTYPAMSVSPLEVGCFHDSVTKRVETMTADRSIGCDGTPTSVTGGTETQQPYHQSKQFRK